MLIRGTLLASFGCWFVQLTGMKIVLVCEKCVWSLQGCNLADGLELGGTLENVFFISYSFQLQYYGFVVRHCSHGLPQRQTLFYFALNKLFAGITGRI